MSLTEAQGNYFPETEIQKQILNYLELKRIFAWPDRQTKGPQRKGFCKSQKGVSDILGIVKGKPLAIEVKRRDGDLSQSQFKFLTRFKEEGGIAIVANCVEDVMRGLGHL